jgi:hypothetical protein
MYTKIAVVSLLGLLFGAASVVQAAERPPQKPSAMETRKLLTQLAGPDKDKGRRAKKRLVEIGPGALAALRGAIAGHPQGALGKAGREVVAEIARREQGKLEAQLTRVKARGVLVRQVREEALARVFPAFLFFSVRFPQYPVAIRPRAPLRAQNIFVMDSEGELEQLYDLKGLEDFYRQHFRRALKEPAARDAVRACLALCVALVQDGFFKFSIPDKRLTVVPARTGLKAAGVAVIEPAKGNRGSIRVTLVFDLDGTLEEFAVYKKGIIKGARPK